jgi:hypothetical protein
MTEKVAARHLCRKAMVYVRQPSVHQVLHNTESRKLQYEMKQRLHSLGWSATKQAKPATLVCSSRLMQLVYISI